MLQYLRSVTNTKWVGYFYMPITHLMYSETTQLISTKLDRGGHSEVTGRFKFNFHQYSVIAILIHAQLEAWTNNYFVLI